MTEPISVKELFPVLDRLLFEALQSCSPEDWQRSTLAGTWTVKDIAAHLLDGNLRVLSMGRDGYFGEQAPAINAYSDLVGWLNQLNADWVQACKRMSPATLLDWLKSTGPEVSAYYHSLPPFSPALFPVAWAGEQESFNWFHLAREYTEKWHHQAQIREALGITAPLLEKELYHPFLQTMVCGLPHHYRNTSATVGTEIQLNISGEAGGYWTLQKETGQWIIHSGKAMEPVAGMELAPEIAWKLFTKGIRPGDLLTDTAGSFVINGNRALAEPILHLIAVMA